MLIKLQNILEEKVENEKACLSKQILDDIKEGRRNWTEFFKTRTDYIRQVIRCGKKAEKEYTKTKTSKLKERYQPY
jgi:hypothetical protein